MKDALIRVIKTINLKRRVTIIRSVNEAIEKLSENEERISFKRLVKILNLCHIFIPVVAVKSNNSTDFSLNIRDLIDMSKSKEKYKRFVEIQSRSLEMMIEAFGIAVNLQNLFLLLTKYMIGKN